MLSASPNSNTNVDTVTAQTAAFAACSLCLSERAYGATPASPEPQRPAQPVWQTADLDGVDQEGDAPLSSDAGDNCDEDALPSDDTQASGGSEGAMAPASPPLLPGSGTADTSVPAAAPAVDAEAGAPAHSTAAAATPADAAGPATIGAQAAIGLHHWRLQTRGMQCAFLRLHGLAHVSCHAAASPGGLRKLGEGGQGVVLYGGEIPLPTSPLSLSLGLPAYEEVVVKRLKPGPYYDPLALRTEYGFALHAMAACPLVVRAFAFDDASDSTLLEYCGGGDLSTKLHDASLARAPDAAAGPLLPWAFVQRYCYSLLLTLSMLHSSGLVHLDVKPANVMFTACDQALLGDFGLAAWDGSEGYPRGTDGYMAPEVQDYSDMGQDCTFKPAADVFSAGVVAARCTAGQWWGEEDWETAPDAVSRLPALCAALGADADAQAFVSLLRGLLARDPSQRLSAQEALGLPFFDGCRVTAQQLAAAVPGRL